MHPIVDPKKADLLAQTTESSGQQPDSDPLVRLADVGTALSLLTRLPVPERFQDHSRIAASVWAYPLVGAALGGLAAGVVLLAMALGLAPGLAAGMALGVSIVITGALHEDGLADCADGFWGGHTADRRLEIMRDSRVGTYGILALCLSVLLRWSALTALIPVSPIAALVVAAAGARAPMAAAMALMAYARPEGLAVQVGRPRRRHAALAVAIATIVALVFPGFAGLAALALGSLAAWGLFAIAQKKIAGMTGDVLGASAQISEITILITLAAMLG